MSGDAYCFMLTRLTRTAGLTEYLAHMFAGLRSTSRVFSIFSAPSFRAKSVPFVAKTPKTEERNNQEVVNYTSFFGPSRGAQSKSGEVVSHETAQSLTAVWACLRVISESISSLSWDVYTDAGIGREKQPRHPVAKLLTNPHPLYSGQTFFETMQAWATLHGNAYAVIIRNGSGQPIQLRHVANNLVKIDYDEKLGQLFYTINSSTTGKHVVLDANNVLHIRAMVWDSENGTGKSPITTHRDTFGLGTAGQGYMSALMKNGANLSGVLTTDMALTKEVAEANRDSWQRANGGVGNSGGTAVLQGGMKYQALSLSPADAQWLEMMKATTEDVSRIFRVPMHMLSALDRSTNNNIEHQGREFVTHTLRPWVKRWEAELTKLFSDRSASYFRFNLDSLMRGDTEARTKMHGMMLSTGTLNRDEVRAIEGYNPIAGGEGKIHLYPVNFAPMAGLGQIEQGAEVPQNQLGNGEEE